MVLMRSTLAQVLESKLRAEISGSRRRPGQAADPLPCSPWSEDVHLFGDSSGDGLDCDSLERLWLAGAVNEMFHVHEIG